MAVDAKIWQNIELWKDKRFGIFNLKSLYNATYEVGGKNIKLDFYREWNGKEICVSLEHKTSSGQIMRTQILAENILVSKNLNNQQESPRLSQLSDCNDEILTLSSLKSLDYSEHLQVLRSYTSNKKIHFIADGNDKETGLSNIVKIILDLLRNSI